MFYTDTVTKDFLRGNWESGVRGSATNRWLIEDPTYTGFYFRFLTDTVYDKSNADLDYLPQGLFLGAENAVAQINNVGGAAAPSTSFHPDSAVNFLQRRGEYYRANMMQEFREGMYYLSTKTPWVFEKVSGLEEIWKIDPKNNFRAKEKVITFECNESINMRMTYLIDLYRKAAFDNAYMRYMLPETQRFFSMELIVTEIRTMRDAVGGQFDPATFIKFTFDYCEFDFIEQPLTYLETQTRYSSNEPTKVKMAIKVGRIREVNTYGLLGALLQDTFGVATREKIAGLKNFTPNTTIKDANGENVTSRASSLQGYKNTDEVSNVRQKKTREERFRADAQAAFNRFAANLETAATAQAVSTLENVRDRAILGNVYGLSPGQLNNALGNILNNPISAAQGIISDFTLNQPPVQAILGNITLTGRDNQLLSQLAQSVAEISQIVAGSELESSSIGDIIANLNASQNLVGGGGNASLTSPNVSLVGSLGNEPLQGVINASTNPGSVTFIAPSIMSTAMGQILFQSGGGSLDGGVGSIILSGPPTSLEGNPGNSVMDGASSPLEGNPGTETLDGVSPTPISSATVNLVEPPKSTAAGGSVTLEGTAVTFTPPDNVSLSSAEPAPSQLSNVDLASPPPTTLSGLPIVDLQAPRVNDGAALGNQILESPAIKPSPLVQVPLDEAPVSTDLETKSVSLDSAKITEAGLTKVILTSSDSKERNLEPVPLNGPVIADAVNPKNADLSGVKNALQTNLLGNDPLLEAPVVNPKLGQIELQETVSGFKDPGNANLDSPDTNIQSNSYLLGKELFGNPEDDKKIILGKESLDGPSLNIEKNSEDLGNQNLKESPVDRRKPNPDNADLQ